MPKVVEEEKVIAALCDIMLTTAAAVHMPINVSLNSVTSCALRGGETEAVEGLATVQLQLAALSDGGNLFLLPVRQPLVVKGDAQLLKHVWIQWWSHGRRLLARRVRWRLIKRERRLLSLR